MSLQIDSLIDEWPIKHRMIHSKPLNLVVGTTRYLEQGEIVLLGHHFVEVFLHLSVHEVEEVVSLFGFDKDTNKFVLRLIHFLASCQDFP